MIGSVRVEQADVFRAELPLGEARVVVADPPYTEDDYFGYGTRPRWGQLVRRMVELGAPDCAFVLHCGSSNVAAACNAVQRWAPKRRQRFRGQPRWRCLAWAKEWSSWRPNVTFQYAWEPVVVFYGKKYRTPAAAHHDAEADWILCPPQRPRHGCPTEKPERLAAWLLDRLAVGARGRLAVDLYSGSGTYAVMLARYGLDAIAVERRPEQCEAIAARAARDHDPQLVSPERFSPLDARGEKLRLLDVEQTGPQRIRATARMRDHRLGGVTARTEELRERERHTMTSVRGRRRRDA